MNKKDGRSGVAGNQHGAKRPIHIASKKPLKCQKTKY